MRTKVRAPGREPDPRPRPLEGVDIEPGQQCDTGAERPFEVQLALHRPVGDVAHLVGAARLLGEELDHLVLDEGRVDVEDHEPFGPPPEPLGLHGDVEAVRGGHLAQVALQRHRFGPADTELVRVHGVARQADDPVDVRPRRGDRRRDGAEFGSGERRPELVAEHGDGVEGALLGRCRSDPVDLHEEAALGPEVGERGGELVGRGGGGEHCGQRQVAAHQDLLEVLYLGVDELEHRHQVGGDPRVITTGHADQYRAVLVAVERSRIRSAGGGAVGHDRYGTASAQRPPPGRAAAP